MKRGKEKMLYAAFVLLAFFPGILPAEEGASHAVDFAARIQAIRAAKDSLMRFSPDSPIPAKQRNAFRGLKYFPVDPKYRLVGRLQVYGRRRLVQVPTTDGGSMTLERFGRFAGQWEGKPFWLEVYRNTEGGDLEVFFTDPTNGDQTYAGGRYARIEKLDEGGWLLDLNDAYNPYCAYNHDYVCPIPPPQNHLFFPVRAGEKRYGADLADLPARTSLDRTKQR